MNLPKIHTHAYELTKNTHTIEITQLNSNTQLLNIKHTYTHHTKITI